MSNQLNDLLIQTIEDVASLEDFPSDWKDWGYWGKERSRRFSSSLAPHDLAPHELMGYIEDIEDGESGATREVIELLIDKTFLSEGSDVRKHPLWESILRLARHPDLKDSDRREIFHYCSEEGLYLRIFSFTCYLAEEPEGGEVIDLEVRAPENTRKRAHERAKRQIQDKSEQLAREFGLEGPCRYRVGAVLSDEWAPQPEKNALPSIRVV